MSNMSYSAFKWDNAVSLWKLLFGRLLPNLKITNIEDLKGKTAIVTGSNSGIGLQVALDLAKQGARVYLACRNESKAKQAANEIISEVPSAKDQLHTLTLDTSSLSSVRECAKAWESQGSKIDILFHNAGRGDSPDSHYSPDGFPLIYSTNFLGSFLLTYLLEPHLSSNARVILTSSTGQYNGAITSDFSVTSVQNSLERGFHCPPIKSPSPVAASLEYCNSKTMQCAFAKLLTQHWARQSKQSGKPCKMIAHSFTPGFTSTPIFSKIDLPSYASDPMFWLLKATENIVATPVQQGALTGVWLASTTDTEVVGEEKGGAYWDRMTRRLAKTDLLDQETLDRLWIRWEADAGVEWR